MSLPTPPKRRLGISPEAEARLARLAENADFNAEYVETWRQMSKRSLEAAVKEAAKPAAERNAQAVVDAIRDYSTYQAQIDAVFQTLADIQAVRRAGQEAAEKAAAGQKQPLRES
jgi:hypothetical protein